MIALTILIPARDNDGVEYPGTVLSEWHSALRGLWGGYSLPRNEWISGQWEDQDGNLFVDSLRRYVVYVPGGMVQRGVTIRKMVGIAMQLFRQNGIAVEYLGQAEVLTIHDVAS